MKVGGRRGEGGGSAQWGRARGTAAAAGTGRERGGLGPGRRAMAPNAEIFK